MGTSDQASDIFSRGDQLAELADEFLRRHRAGERPGVDEYCAKHPDLADRIRNVFPAIAAIEGAHSSGLTEATTAGERPGSTIGRSRSL